MFFKRLLTKDFINIFLLMLLIYTFFIILFFWLTSLDWKGSHTDVEHLHAVSLILLTFLLVVVAWHQLEQLLSTSIKEQISTQGDFLLRIINQLSSDPIIKAIQILHRLRLEAEIKFYKGSIKVTDEIAHNIYNMRDDINHIKSFIYLKNFLDYLEHIAYLCNKGYVTEKDITCCLDERITTYYKEFEQLIKYYQSKNKDNQPYTELETLQKNINMRSTTTHKT